MENAGIDSALFSKIVICQKNEKGLYYQDISEQLGFFPRDVLVCGDRISIDLVPAKALGYWTVQIRQGRGLLETAEEDVDFTITSLEEMQNIPKQLEEELSKKLLR